ncbi:MAG: Rrf2 family transcriptional regulator [Kiritimatiellae bacterium]|jgi:Rrf2 family protein|nr:Rrf2 family transcriptional regulator [Kiritimatiellia bacterium]
MLKLGKQTHYALVALFHLDRVAPGSRVSTHELSERYDIPEPHLGKVLQKLSRAGLLMAVKGVQGGYELNTSLRSLQLGDLILALEQAPRRRGATPHTILNAFPSCYMQGMVREVENRVLDRIHHISLNELLTEMEIPEFPAVPMEMSL